jgi:ribonuclease III family protein
MDFDILHRELTVAEARGLNPLVLAFVGDAVFEVIVRTVLIYDNRELSAHKLHVKAISYVKAKAQSNALRLIQEKLTEEELSIFKRGRNTKSSTVPKNADVQDYRTATGFEALIGFLYITGQKQRIEELLRTLFSDNEQ